MHAPVSEKRAANAAINPAFAAMPNQRALAGQGRPLSRSERGSAERAYGADLGHVRVHDGPSARQSADALGAHGWSFGEHVVLGNTSRPDTLNHELAHVVQQRHAPAKGAPRLGAPDAALERDADRSAATGQPPALQASTREVRMQDWHPPLVRPVPAVQPQQPQPRAAYQPAAPAPAPQMTVADRLRIDTFLNSHHFHLMGLQPSLDGQAQSPDALVERVRILVLPNIPRTEIQSYIELRVHMLRREALMPSRGFSLGNSDVLGGPGPRMATPTQLTLPLSGLDRRLTGNGSQPQVPGWQWALGLAVQPAGHRNASGGAAGTPSDTTLQFSAAPTYAAHPDGESGMEYGIPLQIAFNATTRTASVGGGGQVTAVSSLLGGLLQLQSFVQLMASVAYDGRTWSGQFQPTIGAAVVIQLFQTHNARHNISGSLFVQGFTGATYSHPGENTSDRGGAVGFQLNFSHR